MIDPSTEQGKKLAALSQRLRVLHTELAELGDDMRAEQLRDEVQRATSSLPPNERQAFLAELLERFPVWSNGAVAAPTPAPVAAAPAPAPEIKDPRILADKLIEASRALGESERLAIAQKLSGAGFAVVTVREAPGGLPAAQIAEFRKVVGLVPDAPVDAARLVELASLLSEFTLKLEPWACSYWRDLAPDAKNSVLQTLNKDLARFASGDEKLNKEGLAKNIYKLRSLVSLLMKGVIEAGKQFSRDHLGRYSIEAIGASAPKGSFTKSQAVCNWEQYVKLMEGVDGAALEKRLKQVIAKDVDAGLSQVIR